jgi:hypothetical protein
MSTQRFKQHTYTETDWNPSTWEEAVNSTDPHFVYLASKAYVTVFSPSAVGFSVDFSTQSHAEKAVWDFFKEQKPAFAVARRVFVNIFPSLFEPLIFQHCSACNPGRSCPAVHLNGGHQPVQYDKITAIRG